MLIFIHTAYRRVCRLKLSFRFEKWKNLNVNRAKRLHKREEIIVIIVLCYKINRICGVSRARNASRDVRSDVIASRGA